MTKDSAVDVLLPVYNGARTVREAVGSLLGQTLPNLRIIIVDDGSTDETPQILSELAKRDPRITVRTSRNGGIVEALNAGLELCDGEFVARQDADDFSDPTRLEIQLNYLLNHPDCVAVSGGVRHIDDVGRYTGTIQIFPLPNRADPRWAPSREPYLSHPFLMARRAAIQSAGGYRFAHYSEDTDLYWRLLELGRLHNIEIPLGNYRMHTGSISGASVVNGRIMAVNSQLAGLSALRRRAGQPDIHFKKTMLDDYHRARDLSGIYELAKTQLNDGEAKYLRIAVAAKLLELTSYRPYELESEDCVFIRDARRELAGLSVANRAEFDRLTAASSARLLTKWMVADAVMLAPFALYLSVLARAVIMCLPGPLRKRIIGKARQRML